MLSIDRGLPYTRGLSQKNILSSSRGLKDIQKVKLFLKKYDEDEEFEALINEVNQDVDLIFRFSPNTKETLDKVYNKYADLYGNDINYFREKMKEQHFFSNGKLNKENIVEELRNRKYYKKHYTKRPDRIQYKKEININEI